MQEAVHSCTESASLNNLTSLRGSRYSKLPSCNCAKDDFRNGCGNELEQCKGQKPSLSRTNSNSRTCISSFFSLLYRFLVAFLRALCFRLPRNIDNESLLTVDYKGECSDDQACHVVLLKHDNSPINCALPSRTASPKESYVEIASNRNGCVELQCKVIKPNDVNIAVDKIRASQVKGKVIASKGKDQLTATKAVVDKSKQQLREVCDDVTNIRSDIRAAKKLFSEVEKGIKEYKWDTFARDSWATVEHNGQITYFPVLSAPLYASPYQKMYSEHRIFIEEMKFHFKWNHGILI